MPRNKEFIEEDVLNKAKELFRKNGYNGTSMDELVKATGLSRSSIYDSFGDKHALYLKSLQQYSNQSQISLVDTIDKLASPKKRIVAFFDKLIDDILNDTSNSGCFMVNATTELAHIDEKISSLACSNIQLVEDKLYGWVKEAQAAGEVSKKIPARSLARHLYNSFTGLRVTGKARPDKAFLKDVMKTSLTLLDV